MDGQALDKKHSERISTLMKSFWEGDDDAVDDIIFSEKVSQIFGSDSIAINSFDIDAIASYIPYSNNIYVMVCPCCINNDNFDKYKILVETGSIIPVLGANYACYDTEVLDFSYSHDHIGRAEYFALRTLFASSPDHGRACEHCVSRKFGEIRAAISRKRSVAGLETSVLSPLWNNLHPYISPDFDLLNQAEAAVRSKDATTLKSLVDMSFVLSNMRTASVFNSPVIIGRKNLLSIPEGYADSVDDANRGEILAQKRISEGLGLRIPQNVNLSRFIEIASDFRPRIAQLSNAVIEGTSVGDASMNLDREIMRLNAEVARVEKLGRFVALSAIVEFYKSNQTILNAAAVAGALSIDSGIAGCAGGVATAAAGAAKQKGIISTGPSVERLQQIASNSLKPYVNAVIAKYVGSTGLAISALSLKKDMAGAE